MNTPHFLILIEGENDVTDLLELFNLHYKNFLEENNIQIKTDLSRDIIELVFDKNIATIFIKNSISQNLKNFNDTLKNSSVEKIYNINKHLIAIYSIYDLDHGSTTPVQHKDYLKLLKENENYYPLLCYPGYEAHYIQNVHKELVNNIDKLVNEKSLDNISTLIENFKFNTNNIELKAPNNISTIVKKFVKQLKRSNFYKDAVNSSSDILENNFNYIANFYNQTDYFYFLEHQSEIYEQSFFENDKIILASFIVCVFKNIVEWISGEEED